MTMDERKGAPYEQYRHTRTSFDSDISGFSINSINAASDQTYSPFFPSNALSAQLSTDSGTLVSSLDMQQQANEAFHQLLMSELPEAGNISVLQLMETEYLMQQQAQQTKQYAQHQADMYTVMNVGVPEMRQPYMQNDADLFLTTQEMVQQQIMEGQLMGSPKTPAAALMAEQNMLRGILNASPRLKGSNLSGSPTLAQQRLKSSPSAAQQHLKTSPTLAQRRLLNSPSPRMNNVQLAGVDRHLRRSYSAYPMDNKTRPTTMREQLSCGNLHTAHARDVYAPAQPRPPKKRTSDAALQQSRPRSLSSAAIQRSASYLPRPSAVMTDPSPLGMEQMSTAPLYPTQHSMDYLHEVSHQLKRHQSDPILGNFQEANQHLYNHQGQPSPQMMQAMLADLSGNPASRSLNPSDAMNNLGYGFDQISIASPVQVAQQLAEEVLMSPELMHSTLQGISPQLINRSLAATPSSWNNYNESQYNSIGLPTSMLFNVPDNMHNYAMQQQHSPQVRSKASPLMMDRSISMVRSVSGKSSMETMLITLSTHCKWHGCGLVFNTFQEFQDHLETVHIGSRKPTYECYWQGCSRNGKSFNKRVKIISHLRTHTGERPFICDHQGCLKSFKRHDALENHKKTHTGKPEFRCTVAGCRKEYYHEKSLKKHRKKEHADLADVMCMDEDDDDEEECEEDEE